jgi:hypothetical protein
MANRVTLDEVKEIIVTDLSNTSINAFITSANITVTAILGGDTTITSAQLKEIERWLTAHFIASGPERQSHSEKAGDATVTYEGKTGKGLNGTSYGQQVIILDTTGKMVAEAGQKKASIVAVTSFD